MNERRCLNIASRIDELLHEQIGTGIDLQRMIAEPLYARDVLLVCDAHRGHELATLARSFREASVESEEPEPEASAGTDSRPGFVSSLFGAFRNSINSAFGGENVRQPPEPPQADRPRVSK